MKPPGIMVGSWPVLPPEAMSESVTLQQQGSVTIKGQVDISDLGCHLGTCSCQSCVQLTPALTRTLWESWPWGRENRELHLLLDNYSTQESSSTHCWTCK